MRSLFALLLVLPGCMAGINYSAKDRAQQCVREYVDGVRWSRLGDAGQYLNEEKRQRLYERMKGWEDELEMADAEVVSIDIDKTDPKKTKAIARVEYTWTLKRRGIVEKTTTRQVWEEKGTKFTLVEEARTKGSPLAIFDEPSRASK